MTEAQDNIDKEALMRRLAKLMAIAQDSRANPAEASAAAGMAERIMRKYQIDHADIVMKEIKSGEHMSTADSVATAKTNKTIVKEVPPWANMLASAVAKFNYCGARIVTTASGDRGIRFFGYESDVQLCKWMYDYLVTTINRLAEEYKWTDDYMENGRSVLTSYRRGVSIGIITAIQKLEKERQQEMTSTGTSLMVVKSDAISAHFGNVFETKRVKGSANIRHDAYSQGFSDGRKVDVARRGVGVNKPNVSIK